MSKTNSRMLVDISGFKPYGAVLDLGYRSNGIMYRAIKRGNLFDEAAISADGPSGSEGTEWVSGLPYELPFEGSKFDMAVSFFSMCLIDGKNDRKKTICEIARVLNESGRLVIWDINRKYISIALKKAIKVIIPGGEMVDMDIKIPVTWKGCGTYTLLPVLEQYFSISDLKVYDDYFYIEACKKTTDKG